MRNQLARLVYSPRPPEHWMMLKTFGSLRKQFVQHQCGCRIVCLDVIVDINAVRDRFHSPT